MDILRYGRGLLVAIAFVLLFLVGLVLLGIVALAAWAILALVGLVLGIIALLLLPHYLGEKKGPAKKRYTVRKVKE